MRENTDQKKTPYLDTCHAVQVLQAAAILHKKFKNYIFIFFNFDSLFFFFYQIISYCDVPLSRGFPRKANIQIATQNVILTFFSQPTHPPPLKKSNVERTTFINHLVIRVTLKMCYFLILRDVTYFHVNGLVLKHLPRNIVIQSQSSFKPNTAREMIQRNREKTSLKHVQIQKSSLHINIMECKHCMGIFYC